MKIGILNAPASGLKYEFSTWRVGGKIPCPPDRTENGVMTWKWQTTMQTGVEFVFRFEKKVFVSSVSLSLGEKTRLTRAEVLTRDGEERAVALYRGETIDRGNFGQAGSFGGALELSPACAAKCFVVRLFPDLHELVLPEPVLFGADFDAPVLYPTPVGVTWGAGALPLPTLSCARADGHPDSAFALSFLAERLAEQWDVKVTAGDTVQLTHDDNIPADGYRLEVNERGARLAASTRLGLLYAVERLLELIEGDRVPFCRIEDEPYKQMRGFHTGLPPREQIPLFKKFLKAVLIPYRYNQILIEFAGGMRFDTHPEISEAWLRGNEKAAAGEIPPFPHGKMGAGGKLLEKDEVRDLCDYARELGFELIPEVQSFGHVQYITYAHPEIAETDESVSEREMDTRDADQPPSTYYFHSYCPQNEKSYAIIRDLIDEIVDVVKPPRFVHMGHDEIYQIGLCPKCRGVAHDLLYEKHVRAMHDYLSGKGLRMMLWSDMLQPTEKRYQTSPAVSRLPRDIVMLDFIWYFHFDLDLEDNLLPYGYEVVMGNLYSSHYPRFESRIAKERMIGGQVSTWVVFDEYSLAKKGKFYDLMYCAEMLWNKDYDHRAREVLAKILKERIPVCRDRLHGKYGVKRKYAPLALPPAEGKAPSAVREACAGRPDLALSPTRLSGAVTVPVGGKADALRFIHTTTWEEKRIAWVPLTVIGRYTVRYEDGSEAVIPVEYDGNIRVWNKRWGAPRPEGYYRHQGYVGTWFSDPVVEAKSEEGGDVTLLGYEWENPHPEKAICEVVCAESENSAAGLLLCGVDRVTYTR